MRIFNIYDLKNGNDQVWIFEDQEQDGEDIYLENEDEQEESVFITIIKMLIPAVISLIVYWLLCEHLYNMRGGYAMGSEIIVPPLMWYLLYRFIDSLF